MMYSEFNIDKFLLELYNTITMPRKRKYHMLNSWHRAFLQQFTIDKDQPMLHKYLIILLSSLLFSPALLHAGEPDPILKTIHKAIEEYENNDFSNAASSLDYASQLIRQKKGEALTKLLPPPLDGWHAVAGKSQVTAASLFGGGLTAQKRYIKDNSVVDISIITDSPILQSVIMMFSNPIFAASAGQFELINGYKGIVKFEDDNQGTINIVVNNRFLVTLEGKNTRREDLMDYAEHIDLKAIASLP